MKPLNLSFHLSPRETLNHIPSSFYKGVQKLHYLLIAGELSDFDCSIKNQMRVSLRLGSTQRVGVIFSEMYLCMKFMLIYRINIKHCNLNIFKALSLSLVVL